MAKKKATKKKAVRKTPRKTAKKTTKKVTKTTVTASQKTPSDAISNILGTNRVLLALLFLVPGVSKLLFVFGIGSSNAQGMLEGLGFPIASVLAWVLILGELLVGVSFLFKWKMPEFAWIGVIILVVAAVSVHGYASATGWNLLQTVIHLSLATSLLLVAKLESK